VDVPRGALGVSDPEVSRRAVDVEPLARSVHFAFLLFFVLLSL
jgi:hypothetical protein